MLEVYPTDHGAGLFFLFLFLQPFLSSLRIMLLEDDYDEIQAVAMKTVSWAILAHQPTSNKALSPPWSHFQLSWPLPTRAVSLPCLKVVVPSLARAMERCRLRLSNKLSFTFLIADVKFPILCLNFLTITSFCSKLAHLSSIHNIAHPGVRANNCLISIQNCLDGHVFQSCWLMQELPELLVWQHQSQHAVPMCNLYRTPVAPLPLAYWPCRPHSNMWLEVAPLNDTSACSFPAHFVAIWDLFAEIHHSLLWHQIHLCHVAHLVIKAGDHSHLYNCLSSTKQWYDHPLKDTWCVRIPGLRQSRLLLHCHPWGWHWTENPRMW